MTNFIPGTAGLQDFVNSWKWFLALGIFLIMLGGLAVGSSLSVRFFSMVLLGWLLVMAAILVGILYVAVGFKVQMGRAFPASSLVVGFMLVAHPGTGNLTVTLLIAIFFLISGAFRIISSVSMRFPQWGWVVLNGLVTSVLGILVLCRWPASEFRIVGLFIGVDFILSGWSWVMLSAAAHRLAGKVSLNGLSTGNDLLQTK